ncbi:tetratricopeptide repeat protein [Acidiphilium sp.]|uniref:tetratricopeptide repeat protein n=1 Tax=Acidiphilium sp. TaxID=527 RepID=UPI003D007E82
MGETTIGNQTLNVAQSALAGGNPQMALTVANAVLKSNPDDAEALIIRGDAYFVLKNCAAASADYQKALHISPHAVDAELGLGRCALPNDPRAATIDFTRATSDAPKNAAAFNDLGIALADQSEFTGAARAFRSALAITPSMQSARVNLGLTLALAGQPGEGETILGPIARSAATNPRVRADYATALALAGHPSSAQRILLTDMPAVEAQATVAQMDRLKNLPAAAAIPKPTPG